MLLTPPTSEQQIQIRKALNEDISRREQDIDAIKTWFYQQPHLPHRWAETEDECILSFLRGCNFSLERCKQKLEMYFTMRTMVPEIFANRDISSLGLQDMVSVTDFATLPELTPEGRRVHVTAAIKEDFETQDIAYLFKLAMMLEDVLLKVDRFGVTGHVYIFDANLDLKKHFFKISLTMVKKFLICIQEAYPIKIKEVHIVNLNPFVEFVVNALKPFMKQKLVSRIHFHSKLESLYEFVPKSMLPEEYGGSGGKMETLKGWRLLKEIGNKNKITFGNILSASWLKQLEEFTPWFKEQENLKTDLSKRPVKLKSYEDLFGLDGSFRKLNVD